MNGKHMYESLPRQRRSAHQSKQSRYLSKLGRHFPRNSGGHESRTKSRGKQADIWHLSPSTAEKVLVAFSRYIQKRKGEGEERGSGPADIWEDVDGDLGDEGDLHLGLGDNVDESLQSTSISRGHDEVTESEANATGGSLSDEEKMAMLHLARQNSQLQSTIKRKSNINQFAFEQSRGQHSVDRDSEIVLKNIGNSSNVTPNRDMPMYTNRTRRGNSELAFTTHKKVLPRASRQSDSTLVSGSTKPDFSILNDLLGGHGERVPDCDKDTSSWASDNNRFELPAPNEPSSFTIPSRANTTRKGNTETGTSTAAPNNAAFKRASNSQRYQTQQKPKGPATYSLKPKEDQIPKKLQSNNATPLRSRFGGRKEFVPSGVLKTRSSGSQNSTQNFQTTKTAPTAQERTLDKGSYLTHKKNPDTNEWEEEVRFKGQPNVTYDTMEFIASSGRNDEYENGDMEYESSPEVDTQHERVSMYPDQSYSSRPIIRLDPHKPMSLKVLKNLLSEIEQNSSKKNLETGVKRQTQNNPRNLITKQNSKTRLHQRDPQMKTRLLPLVKNVAFSAKEIAKTAKEVEIQNRWSLTPPERQTNVSRQLRDAMVGVTRSRSRSRHSSRDDSEASPPVAPSKLARPSKSYEYERQRRLTTPALSNLDTEEPLPSNRQVSEQGLFSSKHPSDQAVLSNRLASEQNKTHITNRLMKDVNPRFRYLYSMGTSSSTEPPSPEPPSAVSISRTKLQTTRQQLAPQQPDPSTEIPANNSTLHHPRFSQGMERQRIKARASSAPRVHDRGNDRGLTHPYQGPRDAEASEYESCSDSRTVTSLAQPPRAHNYHQEHQQDFFQDQPDFRQEFDHSPVAARFDGVQQRTVERAPSYTIQLSARLNPPSEVWSLKESVTSLSPDVKRVMHTLGVVFVLVWLLLLVRTVMFVEEEEAVAEERYGY